MQSLIYLWCPHNLKGARESNNIKYRLSRQQLTDKSPSGPAGPACQLDVLHVAICTFTKGLFLPMTAPEGSPHRQKQQDEGVGLRGCCGFQRNTIVVPNYRLIPTVRSAPRALSHSSYTDGWIHVNTHTCRHESKHMHVKKKKKKLRSDG